MGDAETKNLFSGSAAKLADDAYIAEIGKAKRFLEYTTLEPGFKEKFMVSPSEALAEYGLGEDADIEAFQILSDTAAAEAANRRPPKELPRLVRRYRAFIKEKITHRTILAEKGCAPSHPAFAAWRGRQLNRCWAELGNRNASIIHTPLAFELSLGCSVGCPFCGIAAGKLQKVFQATEENRKLWRSVLKTAKEIIGPAAGTGTCYYASEPLDCPDYEVFTTDYADIMGEVPQITTAAAMRGNNPARLKKYLHAMNERQRKIHRFSLLSLDIFHKAMASFTPSESVLIEFLPQYPEAPSCGFARTGRAFNGGEKVETSTEGNTIACVTGFIVNMAEKSIRLITPCASSAAHPTGELHLAREYFSDAADFKAKISGLIDKYMRVDLPTDLPLVLRKNISYAKTDEGIEFFAPVLFRLKFKENDDITASFYHRVLDELEKEEKRDRYAIAAALLEDGLDAAQVFFILNKFTKAGLFYEPYEIYDKQHA